MLDQNTALNKKIPVSFCQSDLRLGRGEGGRDESLCSLHLPSAAFGKKKYTWEEGQRTRRKKDRERERKRGGRKKETGLGGDDGGGGQKLQGTKSLKKLRGWVGENKDTCARGAGGTVEEQVFIPESQLFSPFKL